MLVALIDPRIFTGFWTDTGQTDFEACACLQFQQKLNTNILPVELEVEIRVHSVQKMLGVYRGYGRHWHMVGLVMGHR